MDQIVNIQIDFYIQYIIMPKILNKIIFKGIFISKVSFIRLPVGEV